MKSPYSIAFNRTGKNCNFQFFSSFIHHRSNLFRFDGIMNNVKKPCFPGGIIDTILIPFLQRLHRRSGKRRSNPPKNHAKTTFPLYIFFHFIFLLRYINSVKRFFSVSMRPSFLSFPISAERPLRSTARKSASSCRSKGISKELLPACCACALR